MIIEIGIAAGVILLLVLWLLGMYRIVPPSEAHMIVRANMRAVRSTDKSISSDGKGSYFKFPIWIPKIGTQVRIIPLTTMEIRIDQETFEKGQARYNLVSSTKFRITDVNVAAERFTDLDELKKQLEEIIKAGVRTVTVRYDVSDARAKKKEIAENVNEEIKNDLETYGVSLVNFQLVDFQDTPDSKVISNISMIREKEIEANRRQQNAEREKLSKIKEAESDEMAKQREIARDQKVGEYTQNRDKAINEQKKAAVQAAYEVTQVEQVRAAEIEKAKQIVIASQLREVEEINKAKKLLVGQGDRQMQEEQAKGAAAAVREQLLAEADGKQKLQESLNKFGDAAIRALVAEKVVAAYQTVGVESAKALQQADVKIMSGGDGDAFNTAKMTESMRLGSPDTAVATLNKIARQLDLGSVPLFQALGKMDEVAAKRPAPTSMKGKQPTPIEM